MDYGFDVKKTKGGATGEYLFFGEQHLVVNTLWVWGLSIIYMYSRQECIPVGYVPSAKCAKWPNVLPRTPLPYTSLPHVPHHAHTPCHTFPSNHHTHTPAMHAPRGQNDRRLWKHYLSATTDADGNYTRLSNNYIWVWRNSVICLLGGICRQ